MAKHFINGVYGDDGNAYAEGTDYEPDGSGSITTVPGSALADYIAGGGSVKISRAVADDTEPSTPTTMQLDESVSGVWKIASPDASPSGSAIPINQQSLKVAERAAGQQSTIRFMGWADDAAVKALVVDDYVYVRIATKTYAGTRIADDSWVMKITKADPVTGTGGLRQINFTAMDLTTDIRQVPTNDIPRRLLATRTVLPGDTGSNFQQANTGGPQAFRLSDLARAVQPTGTSIQQNAPDYYIDRLPKRGDAMDLLAHGLNVGSSYMFWEQNRLVLEQHDRADAMVSGVLTAGNVYEAGKADPTETATYDRVVVETPPDTGSVRDDPTNPDLDVPTQGEGGVFTDPDEAQTYGSSQVGGEITIYRILENWTPAEQFVNFEPQPLMAAMGDVMFSIAGYSGDQIYNFLKYQPQQVVMTPRCKYSDRKVNAPNGTLDYVFYFPCEYVQIQTTNDFIDGWVVSKNGYFTTTGAVGKEQLPVGGAVVVLVGVRYGNVYRVRTNAVGYYRVQDAVPDRYSPHVYLEDDSYLANKHSQYTDPHAYDEDTANDETGPNNSTAREAIFQIFPTTIDFRVAYRTLRPNATQDSVDLDRMNATRRRGRFSYGTAGGNDLVLEDFNDVLVDTANLTSDVQVAEFGEKVLDRNAEAKDSYVITKAYGGTTTKVGTVQWANIVSDTTIQGPVRVMAREIVIESDGLVKETLSTEATAFMGRVAKEFARNRVLRHALDVTGERLNDIYSRLANIRGELESSDAYGRG